MGAPSVQQGRRMPPTRMGGRHPVVVVVRQEQAAGVGGLPAPGL